MRFPYRGRPGSKVFPGTRYSYRLDRNGHFISQGQVVSEYGHAMLARQLYLMPDHDEGVEVDIGIEAGADAYFASCSEIFLRQ